MSFSYDENTSHPGMIEALRNTLQTLERDGDIDPCDPAYIELKSSIMRTIGELELKKKQRSVLA